MGMNEMVPGTRWARYPIERDEIREYPFAAVLSAKVSRTIVGHFLGPCYRYTARFHGWSGTGNTVAEAIAALVRAIEGPCAEWPEE